MFYRPFNKWREYYAPKVSCLPPEQRSLTQQWWYGFGPIYLSRNYMHGLVRTWKSRRLRSKVNIMTLKTTHDLRPLITACRKCHTLDPLTRGEDLIWAPRFGTGCAPVDGVQPIPKLMIVGQNPPQDKVRCQHGAWMLHYNGPDWDHLKGPHELLVKELVEYLGLEVMREVYATQMTKCPTQGNVMAPFRCVMACRDTYFVNELKLLKPERVLVFGTQAHNAMQQLLQHEATERGIMHWYGVEPVGKPAFWEDRYAWHTRRWVNNQRAFDIIQAAHPSSIGRFVTKESWLRSIKEAFDAR